MTARHLGQTDTQTIRQTKRSQTSKVITYPPFSIILMEAERRVVIKCLGEETKILSGL